MVKKAGKRIKKYKNKLEKPVIGQVYHTVLKKVREEKQYNYIENAGCLSTLDYIVYHYAYVNNLSVMSRAVLIRLIRMAFSDYIEFKSIHYKTKQRCYKWLSWIDNYVDICYNFWILVEEVLSDCTKIFCLESDCLFTDIEFHERSNRLNNAISSEVVIGGG